MSKQVLISEEGQERLFRLIKRVLPNASDDMCRAVLWGSTDAPYAEYRKVKKQLEEYLDKMNK